jgi:hypothetical protein
MPMPHDLPWHRPSWQSPTNKQIYRTFFSILAKFTVFCKFQQMFQITFHLKIYRKKSETLPASSIKKYVQKILSFYRENVTLGNFLCFTENRTLGLKPDCWLCKYMRKCAHIYTLAEHLEKISKHNQYAHCRNMGTFMRIFTHLATRLKP